MISFTATNLMIKLRYDHSQNQDILPDKLFVRSTQKEKQGTGRFPVTKSAACLSCSFGTGTALIRNGSNPYKNTQHQADSKGNFLQEILRYHR